jgi:hypothetical protein
VCKEFHEMIHQDSYEEVSIGLHEIHTPMIMDPVSAAGPPYPQQIPYTQMYTQPYQPPNIDPFTNGVFHQNGYQQTATNSQHKGCDCNRMLKFCKCCTVLKCCLPAIQGISSGTGKCFGGCVDGCTTCTQK